MYSHNSNFKNYVRIDGSSISGYGGMGSSFNTGVTLIDDAGNAGMPTAEWYMLISAGGDGTRCQLAVALFTGKIYWRNCAAGKWSEYRKCRFQIISPSTLPKYCFPFV